MEQVSLPVKSIAFSCTDADKAYLDNYRLRLTGVTAELKLYEADTGMAIADTTAARTEDTAYRLSWCNASGEYCVAKIYNNGELLKTVEMPAGADSIAVGLVKGESLLSVTVEKGTAPQNPDYDQGNFDWMAGEVAPPETTDPFAELQTVVPNTDGAAAGSAPENNVSATPTDPAPNGNDAPGAAGKGLSGGWIALIVIGAVLALAGGGFALCYYVIKPKWLMDLKLNKAALSACLAFVRTKALAVLAFIKSKIKK